MISSYHQTEVCLQAWLHCEDVLTVMPENTSEKTHLKQLVNECATVCLGMMEALRERSINTEKLALLCVGICEECAEVCERFHSVLFSKCADACRRCADTLSSLANRAIAS